MLTGKYSRTIIDIVVGLALIAYAFRDADGALVKYLLSLLNLQSFWYFPDLLGFLCLAILAWRALELGLLLFLGLIFYSVVGYMVTGSLASVGAGEKMLLPLFCGLLLQRSELDRTYVDKTLIFILVISFLGVFYSRFYSPPWAGAAFETIDGVKAAKATMFGYGQARLTGLNEDPHGAAFTILALCMLVFSNRRSMLRILLLFPPSLLAIYLTTSRSSLISACLFGVLLLFLPRNAQQKRSLVLRLGLFVSFMLFVIPLALMIYFSDVQSIFDVPYEMRSLYARARESWIQPFEVMDTLAPYAYLHGYGLGGVGFPVQQSNISSYFSPVDNFFLFNYLMFGLPYVLVYVVVAWAVLREQDQYKYITMTIATMFGHFILGYGSSLFLIVYGFSINGIVPKFRFFHARQRPMLQRPPIQRAVGELV